MRRAATAVTLGVALAMGVTACGAGLEPRQVETGAAPTSAAAVPATTAPADEPAEDPSLSEEPEEDASPVELLDVSVERTTAFETARFEVVVTADAERLTGLNPLGPLQATGELADFGAALRMEMVVEPVGAVTQTIVDGVAYIEEAGTGCGSVELPEAPLAGPYTGSFDPAMFLQQLRAVGEVSDLGPHDVRGVATTHLAGSFTARAALEQATTDETSSVEELAGLLPDEYLDLEQQVDVFIDADGLLRRVQVETPEVTVDGPEPAISTIVVSPTTVIFDLFDFDADISIVAPADCEPVTTGFQQVN